MNRRLRFIFEKETKGAVQYKEVGSHGTKLEQRDAVIGTIYIRKTAFASEDRFAGQYPSKLEITVNIDES